VLLALAEQLRAAPNTRAERFRRKDGQLVVPFPDGLAGVAATPQAALDALAQDGLLEVNPLAPLRRVVQIDGLHGLILTAEASRHVLARMGASEPDPALDQPAPKPDPQPLPAEAPRGDADATAPAPAARRPGGDSRIARALVVRIRARDAVLDGEVSREDGWLCVGPEVVRAWAQAHGVQGYVLIRSLGHLPGCRVTPDGGLAVAEEP
jgi:hypothetical protein